MNRKKILAISGSTRKGSSNEHIIRYISTAFAPQLAIDLYDSIDQLPHFNPDLDTADNLPPVVTDLRARIAQADGVIFCTPEYVFSLPGSLKNAIEWQVSTTLFSHKPVAIIVASASGEKAMESLQLVMRTLESNIAPNATTIIKGAKGKIDSNGNIKDEGTKEQIATVVASLLESINRTEQQ